MLAIYNQLKKMNMTTKMPSGYVPAWTDTQLDSYLSSKNLKQQFFFGDFGGTWNGLFATLPFHSLSFSEGYIFRGSIKREKFHGNAGTWAVAAGTQIYIDTMKVMISPDRPMVVSTENNWTYSSYTNQDFTPVFTWRRTSSVSYNSAQVLAQTSRWVKDDEGMRSFPIPLLYILGGRYYYFDTRITSTFVTYTLAQHLYGMYFEFEADVSCAPIIINIRNNAYEGGFNVIAGNTPRAVRWVTPNMISPAGGGCKLVVDASGAGDILCSITRY